jgi:hypothetical protein
MNGDVLTIQQENAGIKSGVCEGSHLCCLECYRQ